MKKLCLLPVLLIAFTSSTFAAEPAPTSTPVQNSTPATTPKKHTGGGGSGGGHPCAKLVNACMAAGYSRANPQPGKNFWRDCMKPLKEGQHPAGVPLISVSQADVNACKAAKKPSRRKFNKNK